MRRDLGLGGQGEPEREEETAGEDEAPGGEETRSERGAPGDQTENEPNSSVVACRISQIEGTEKSTSLLLERVVCRA